MGLRITSLSDFLKDILLYSEKTPLLFTRLYFWIFFAVVLAVYSSIYKTRAFRNAFLFLASLFFYYKSSGFFFTILLFSTFSDYILGILIYHTENKLGKKYLLAFSVFINLTLLFYFKYTYFFADSMSEGFGIEVAIQNPFALWSNWFFATDFVTDRILLPVGISFFTFQTISYSCDVYRGGIKPVKNILDFGFYVSFFPQLVAGPIVRASAFIPQLYQKYQVSNREFGLAIFCILKGLIKKMFLADYIAVNFIDRVFANPLAYSGFENLMALYGYSLQVYADFSGYTDVAIGVGLLMGFRLPVNFNSPYKATNIANFWKRWHISLSSWLKDYLYIPMGGSRRGSLFTYFSLLAIMAFIFLLAANIYVPIILVTTAVIFGLIARYSPAFKLLISTNINLMLTMLIGGLWHGASWNFVVWGGLNGVGLVVYKFWRRISPWEHKTGRLIHAWKIFITLNFITFTRTWFRADSFETAANVLHQIAYDFSIWLIPEMIYAYKSIFAVMLLGYIIHWLSENLKDQIRDWFVKSSIWIKIIISFLTIFGIYQVLSSDLQPFIYFQF